MWAKVGVRPPQAEEWQEPPEAERGKDKQTNKQRIEVLEKSWPD